MKVHHLNCATMHPVFPGLMHGDVDPVHRRFVCHCLLVETPDSGLVLIDSGFGTADVEGGSARIGRFFTRLARPKFDLAETALHQIQAMGYSAGDVRHIVLTHLDIDHAGGLGDFPNAKVHVMKAEREAAANPNMREKARYLQKQWAHGPDWVLHEADGEPWFGFESVRDLAGLPPEILLVPLYGHTRGHAAIAVQQGGEWLMHCGDAYFHRTTITNTPSQPFGLSVFETAVQINGRVRKQNQTRLRELAAKHSNEVRIFSAHDSVEWGGCTG